MSTSLSFDQLRLRDLLNGIVSQQPEIRQTRIVEMRILMQKIGEDQVIAAITGLTKPSELRFLIPAGISGKARQFLFNMLLKFEVQGLNT